MNGFKLRATGLTPSDHIPDVVVWVFPQCTVNDSRLPNQMLFPFPPDMLDPERLIQCPLVKHHWIRARRFPYHLVKCKEVSWTGSD